MKYYSGDNFPIRPDNEPPKWLEYLLVILGIIWVIAWATFVFSA